MGTLVQAPRVTSALIGPVGKVIVVRTFDDYCRYFGGFKGPSREEADLLEARLQEPPPMFFKRVRKAKS